MWEVKVTSKPSVIQNEFVELTVDENSKMRQIYGKKLLNLFDLTLFAVFLNLFWDQDTLVDVE